MSSVKLKYKGVVYYISIWTSGVKAYTGIIYDTEYKNTLFETELLERPFDEVCLIVHDWIDKNF